MCFIVKSSLSNYPLGIFSTKKTPPKRNDEVCDFLLFIYIQITLFNLSFTTNQVDQTITRNEIKAFVITIDMFDDRETQ